jgi:hypothetical protein
LWIRVTRSRRPPPAPVPRAGELTAIHVLDESEEAVRDLVRGREDIRRDVLC